MGVGLRRCVRLRPTLTLTLTLRMGILPLVPLVIVGPPHNWIRRRSPPTPFPHLRLEPPHRPPRLPRGPRLPPKMAHRIPLHLTPGGRVRVAVARLGEGGGTLTLTLTLRMGPQNLIRKRSRRGRRPQVVG